MVPGRIPEHALFGVVHRIVGDEADIARIRAIGGDSGVDVGSECFEHARAFRFVSASTLGQIRFALRPEIFSYQAGHVLRVDRVSHPLLVRCEIAEDRGEPVVVALEDRITLVLVAPGAGHRHAHHPAAHHVDDGIEVVVLREFHVGGFVIPDSQPIEPRRGEGGEIAIREFVAGELFDQESVPGEVFVDRVHDPVAISPGGGLDPVSLVAVGVGIADRVEPVSRPFDAMLRRFEKSIDHAFVGARRVVVEERRDFGRGRGETGQVEGDAADEGVSIRFGGG